MYFGNFPKLYYKHPKEENPRLLVDIFRRAGFTDKILGDTSVFYEYSIKENETPRELADRLYGRQDLEWVIPLFNKHMNTYLDWPMNSRTLDKFIDAKYPGISIRLAANQQAVRRKVILAGEETETQLEVDYSTWEALDDTDKSTIDCTLLTNDEWYSYWNNFPNVEDLDSVYADPFQKLTRLGNSTQGTFYVYNVLTDFYANVPKISVGDMVTLNTSILRVTQFKKNLGQLIVQVEGGPYPSNSNQYRILGNTVADRNFESSLISTDTPPASLVVDKTFGSNYLPIVPHKHAVHHYLGNYITDSTGETVYPLEQEIVGRDTDKTGLLRSSGLDFPETSESITQEGKRPVTNYDYEVAVNDAKRRINIPIPEYISTLEESLKKALTS